MAELTPAQQQLLELQAQVEAQSEERAKRQAERKAAIDLRMAQERVKLPELEEKYGVLGYDTVAVFAHNTGKMIFMVRPDPAPYKAFQTEQLRDKVNADHCYTLVRSCLKYPDPKTQSRELGEIFDETPGILLTAANAAAKLAGAAAQEVEGK